MSRVDVLAVLESAAMWCQSKSAVGSDLGLVDARAAVADLIVEVQRVADGTTGDLHYLRAALARVGGAA